MPHVGLQLLSDIKIKKYDSNDKIIITKEESTHTFI
jgi:hypothetical protein